VSHPPPPPVDYFTPPGNRRDPWRPWWLRVMLALRIRRGRLLDEDRRQQYLEDTRYASDE
jgi:hypothetical protein